ncbi:MAG: hypothetical protein II001_04630 [Bacteroidales bacterium]|jgi:hypothetical protein|nr:hypothetical protein [Bacteroidales bacterium]MBQ4147948.1 hypothetical protein [Prevotella sp.]
MKKIVMTMLLMSVMLIGFSQQRQQPMSKYVVSQDLIQKLSSEKVEQMRSENPAELIRMNYCLINTAVVTSKLWDGNIMQMGTLEQYLPQGVSYVEEDIIQKGYVDPYIWNLPQDDYRYTAFKLRRNGWYVVVLPKTLLEQRVQAQLNSYSY